MIEVDNSSSVKQSVRKRLTREEWLSNALELLGEQGDSRLRIETLTQLMGVTKGSFYWHFKNRKDFVVSLAEYWIDRSTTGVLGALLAMKASPEEKLLELARLIDEEEWTRYDLPIRAWATHQPEVMKILRRADTFRRDYIRSLFHEMGFEGDDLDTRTETFLVFYSSERSFPLRSSREKRARQKLIRHDILTKRDH